MRERPELLPHEAQRRGTRKHREHHRADPGRALDGVDAGECLRARVHGAQHPVGLLDALEGVQAGHARMVHAFDGAFEAADRAVQVGRVVGHGHVGLLEHAVGQRMVDHDAVGGGDEHVARLAEAHVGQFAQDVAVLQVDGARDHEQHPAGRIEHRLGDGDLRQAVEPVAVRLGDHARARGDRVLEVRAVLHVHLADLSRAVQVGDQLAVRVQEGDVVERRPQGLVLFQKGLQRRGVRDAVRAHALGDRLQQDAPARELLLHRARDGRQPRELLVGDRGLHAVLDQVQRHRGDDEGGGQHDGCDADAEARVQADAGFPGREKFHGRRAGSAAKRRDHRPAVEAQLTPLACCAGSVSESARNARHSGASRRAERRRCCPARDG
ncbi:hypothetical protein D9M68_468190 [compost metagenome]